jgi:His/Glu/Gln/Arg/opine family amino acid ABC transporter permease subunit
MAQTAPAPPQEPEATSVWRNVVNYLFDVRFLGVLGQIGFILIVVLFIRSIGGNFSENVNKLGRTQFICRDGTFSYRCAYDFMESEAGFDISDTVVEYTNTDPYWHAFYLGILNTLKVAIFGVILTTIVGTAAGIARLSDNWLISKIALWYVELMRNTPLLVQLFFIYFGVLLALPNIDEATQFLGMPIFISNRGLNLPSPEFTSSAPIWLAFLILGIVQFQVVGIILNRKEERTGQATNRLGWGLISFLVIVGIGWFVSGAISDTQGMLVAKTSRVQEIDDFEKVMLARTGLNHMDDLDTLSEEEITAAALQICVLRDSFSETNLTGQLRRLGVPYEISRSNRPDQAVKKYEEGSCEIFAASKAVLAAERPTLENPGNHLVISVQEKPVVWSIPVREGFNLVGGAKMLPEFVALLIGLVLFYGGSLAEIVRAGIMSVTKGQVEAAKALGLSNGQRLQLVVMPQAMRVIIPPLVGIFLSLAKDTSLGIAIGFPDMYMVAYTTMNQSGRILQIFIIMMLVYMLISLTFSVILNWYNERVKLVER